jgi:hypothetical protein
VSGDVHVLIDAEMRAPSKVSLRLEEDVAIRIAQCAWEVTKLVVPGAVFVIERMARTDPPSLIQQRADVLPHTGS